MVRFDKGRARESLVCVSVWSKGDLGVCVCFPGKRGRRRYRSYINAPTCCRGIHISLPYGVFPCGWVIGGLNIRGMHVRMTPYSNTEGSDKESVKEKERDGRRDRDRERERDTGSQESLAEAAFRKVNKSPHYVGLQ